MNRQAYTHTHEKEIRFSPWCSYKSTKQTYHNPYEAKNNFRARNIPIVEIQNFGKKLHFLSVVFVLFFSAWNMTRLSWGIWCVCDEKKESWKEGCQLYTSQRNGGIMFCFNVGLCTYVCYHSCSRGFFCVAHLHPRIPTYEWAPAFNRPCQKSCSNSS